MPRWTFHPFKQLVVDLKELQQRVTAVQLLLLAQVRRRRNHLMQAVSHLGPQEPLRRQPGQKLTKTKKQQSEEIG